ncbi:MAG: MBL fold metallo-hydrolase [Verrucomicrobia bacterium]|nr:MBL fold metallo-hydrolase [Verrucomicrobiota bacterium]
MTLPPSDHFNGKTFFNPQHVNRTWREVMQWRRTSKPAPWPAQVALTAQPPPPAPRGREIVATWINHATFLLQTPQGNILTDPQFSARCGPFGLAGPRRVHPPGVALADLPRIDLILLSHDHYDHCDLASLRALARAHQDSVAITPLRNRDLLARAGLRAIVELDWWQAHQPAAGLKVTVTPSRHWSNRLSGRRNGRLWGGFHLQFADRACWFAGDTGYDAALFPAIREKLGAPDLAMIPIGAYEPRWFMSAQHCNPAEAIQIHHDVGARTSLAMHWGTWQLTDEGREEPVAALAAARTAAGLAPEAFRALTPGESVTV